MYTHLYDPKTLTKKNWKIFTGMVKEFLTILPKKLPSFKGFECFKGYPVKLADFTGREDTVPFIDDKEIALNGVHFQGGEDLSCESFNIYREKQDSFNFCKTSRNPYDLAVVGILMIYSKFGATFKSDKEKIGKVRWDYIQDLVTKAMFAYELRMLLTKYDANLYFWVPGCCDTQGFVDECMKVETNGKSKMISDGWEMNKNNVKLGERDD